MTEIETTETDVLEENETDYGPFAVAAVVLVTVSAASAYAGRNYDRFRASVRDRLAVRRERRELENLASEVERQEA